MPLYFDLASFEMTVNKFSFNGVSFNSSMNSVIEPLMTGTLKDDPDTFSLSSGKILLMTLVALVVVGIILTPEARDRRKS